jgi:hypothetical protein
VNALAGATGSKGGNGMRSIRTSRSVFLAAAAIFGWPARASAIDFTLVDWGGPPPASDPTGAKLTSIVQYVASVYQDIFEDPLSITLEYGYGGLIGESQGLVLHNPGATSGGRQISGYIEVDQDAGGYQWFYDPTPADDSEFDMTQTLWRDLSLSLQTSYFNAGTNIPSTFEVGYRGQANGSDPSAVGHSDLLSHVFRAVGHLLGMASCGDLERVEIADGDFDFNSANVFGKTLAAQCDKASDGYGNATLDDPYAVTAWWTGFAEGTRVRPSHTDLLSMAAGDNFSVLDLPRREFYGGTDWNTPGNWSGNAIPGSADDAFVRASGPNGELRSAYLSANGTAWNLTVAEASNVYTNAFLLYVGGTTTVDGLNTDLVIGTGGTLHSGTLINQNQAQVQLNTGSINVGTLNNNAELLGDGTVTITSVLMNNGSIAASTGTLLLRTTGAASLDLDGIHELAAGPAAGQLLVTTVGSDMVIDGPLSDDFNGTATVGSGNSLNFINVWTLGGAGSGTVVFHRNGVLNLNGGITSATAAVLGGATVRIEGDVNVGTGCYGTISAPAFFSSGNGGANVVVNGTLTLSGAATYQGGSHTGSGRLIWDSDVSVTGSTTISVGQLDLDGYSPMATSNIYDGATLTINSALTDSASGTINISGAMMLNGGSWSNDGTIVLSAGRVGGSSTFTNSGHLGVRAGESYIDAASSFTAASTNTIDGTLHLRGDAVIAGGTWSGTGTLSLDDQCTTFAANTTLGTTKFNMDGNVSASGSVNVNSGATVQVNGVLSDPFNATLNINSGTFSVNGGSWTNAGVVNLVKTSIAIPTIAGSKLLLSGQLNATGTGTAQVLADLVNEGGTINTATGGMLNSTGQFRTDSAYTLTKTGSGTWSINGFQQHVPGSVLAINAGTVVMNSDAGAGAHNLSINLSGGHVRFNTTQHLAGLSVGSSSTAALNASGASVLVTNALTIASAGIVDLADNDLVLDYSGSSPAPTVRQYLITGRHGGAWDGSGVRSSSATASVGLGYAENAVLGLSSFAGETVDATSILVKYTYDGDANLDGMVDLRDLYQLAAHWRSATDTWFCGDFNYDNYVDVHDLTLLAINWQAGVGSPLASPMDSILASLGLPAVSVPEPAALGGGGVGAFGWLGLRRRRRSD